MRCTRYSVYAGKTLVIFLPQDASEAPVAIFEKIRIQHRIALYPVIGRGGDRISFTHTGNKQTSNLFAMSGTVTASPPRAPKFTNVSKQ